MTEYVRCYGPNLEDDPWERAERLTKERAADVERIKELEEYEAEEAAFMRKRGVVYNCTFIDGWANVLEDREEWKTRAESAEAKLSALTQQGKG